MLIFPFKFVLFYLNGCFIWEVLWRWSYGLGLQYWKTEASSPSQPGLCVVVVCSTTTSTSASGVCLSLDTDSILKHTWFEGDPRTTPTLLSLSVMGRGLEYRQPQLPHWILDYIVRSYCMIREVGHIGYRALKALGCSYSRIKMWSALPWTLRACGSFLLFCTFLSSGRWPFCSIPFLPSLWTL